MGINHSNEIEVPVEDMEKLYKTTKYTPGEILHLYRRYMELIGSNNTKLAKRHLLLYTELKTNPATIDIINSLFGKKNRLNFVEFAQYFHLFRLTYTTNPGETRHRTNLKNELLFNMYDYDKDEVISFDDMYHIVFNLYSDHMGRESILKLTRIVFDQIDESKVDAILFNDFCKALQPLDVDVKLMMKFPSE